MRSDKDGLVYMTPTAPRLTPIERKPTLKDTLSDARITARLAEQAWQRCQARTSAEAICYGQWRYAQGRADVLQDVVEGEAGR